MDTPGTWRKSSYSGGGDGNNCVEIAPLPTHVSIRDSKAPARAILTFPTAAFTCFTDTLKHAPDNWRKSSYSDGGDGNDCVEIANSLAHVAIRDSKAPTGSILTVSADAFTTFVEALKDA
jgi:hypothetical protein